MKRILLSTLALAAFSFTFTSCNDENGTSSHNFIKDPSAIVNSITPTTSGNYNKWLLGNIGQYGYLETQTANDFTTWQFYIICSGGTLEQVGNSRFHWKGTVGDEMLTMNATVDGSWNEWNYTSITYSTTYFIRASRVDDCNEWVIYNSSDHLLFSIKTMKDAGWNKWEIVGDVPESHNMNLVGLFFIPVLYATTQPVIN